MPPVAETFKEAVERLLGEKRSMRWLSRRLEEIDPDKQSAENWRRALNRYDTTWPEEPTAKLIARALEVPRTHLPKAPTVLEMFQEVSGRLEAIAGSLVKMNADRNRSGASIERTLTAILARLRQLELPGEESTEDTGK